MSNIQNWAEEDTSSDEEDRIDEENQTTSKTDTASPNDQNIGNIDIDNANKPRNNYVNDKPVKFLVIAENLPYSKNENDVGNFFYDGGCNVLAVNLIVKGKFEIIFEDEESYRKAFEANGFLFGNRSIRVHDKIGKSDYQQRKPINNVRNNDRIDRPERTERKPYNNSRNELRNDVRHAQSDDKWNSRGNNLDSSNGKPKISTENKVEKPVEPPTPPVRPVLILKPRTAPIEDIGKPEKIVSIFGEGKPRDEKIAEITKVLDATKLPETSIISENSDIIVSEVAVVNEVKPEIKSEVSDKHENLTEFKKTVAATNSEALPNPPQSNKPAYKSYKDKDGQRDTTKRPYDKNKPNYRTSSSLSKDSSPVVTSNEIKAPELKVPEVKSNQKNVTIDQSDKEVAQKIPYDSNSRAPYRGGRSSGRHSDRDNTRSNGRDGGRHSGRDGGRGSVRPTSDTNKDKVVSTTSESRPQTVQSNKFDKETKKKTEVKSKTEEIKPTIIEKEKESSPTPAPTVTRTAVFEKAVTKTKGSFGVLLDSDDEDD